MSGRDVVVNLFFTATIVGVMAIILAVGLSKSNTTEEKRIAFMAECSKDGKTEFECKTTYTMLTNTEKAKDSADDAAFFSIINMFSK